MFVVVPTLIAISVFCVGSWAVSGSHTSANSPAPYRLLTPLLDTPWTAKVGTLPWPQHPRPLLYRDHWQTLNGIWTALSGIMVNGVTYMWFATTFTTPSGWPTGQRLLLNFEAVDYEATVFVNGAQVGFNRGGYFRFTVDITDNVNPDGENALLVFVFDPTDSSPYHIPNGKQTTSPSHIFYTPCTGIWQPVWLESAPSSYITSMNFAADMEGTVTATIHSGTGGSNPVEISILDDDGSVVSTQSAVSDETFTFTVPSPKLWSPDSPNLYNITVKMGADNVSSYTGFRTISSGTVNGIQRPLLNGKFVFQFGTLDQGYWPDGIYLPPTLEAMVYDLGLLKGLGMNMVRKHIKVEPDLFYQACDRLGLLVIQDMPCMPATVSMETSPPDAAEQAEFERQIEVLINEHKSYPSIVTWVIYNEGWGQLREASHPEFPITTRIRELDPTRLIDATTGWFDHGAGDFSDNHHYAEPQCGTPFYSTPSSPYDPNRIGLQGEFGGIGHIPAAENLWPVQAAIDTINQTYEINSDLDSYNYRAHVLLGLLRDQVARFACSGAVWTQTTDVEGEVNGLVTYDRRFVRVDAIQWKADIQALYAAAGARA
ncbi:glycoside hydrolase family 2 protein [Lasiosphaeris hirsuta]|uniref:Glycoside hydrolase family 2 protein n=1 Tax=Lasiosphaeris hirsuta TaxID=260670 RepID=A0AA40B9T4_9PEZI|nr:glycoside hydrolase family 2 protein [Lasiosphaeris hirsuta]